MPAYKPCSICGRLRRRVQGGHVERGRWEGKAEGWYRVTLDHGGQGLGKVVARWCPECGARVLRALKEGVDRRGVGE